MPKRFRAEGAERLGHGLFGEARTTTKEQGYSCMYACMYVCMHVCMYAHGRVLLWETDSGFVQGASEPSRAVGVVALGTSTMVG